VFSTLIYIIIGTFHFFKSKIEILYISVTDAADTVICLSDDGWCYHPKYVEQFPHKIICITLHLVGYILEYFRFSFACRKAKRQWLLEENFFNIFAQINGKNFLLTLLRTGYQIN
jgi:hypothetical protein